MDEMTELTDGDATVWRRLEAYAETRLSPDLTTSSRLRARVMAVAHRRAALVRADAGLTVLPHIEPAAAALRFSPRTQALARASHRRRGRPLARVAAVVLAASLTLGVAVGGAFAARPGAPLYEARLWAETLTLPTDPSARALAELERLQDRLREIGEASLAGDAAGATAALTAYQRIVDEASASAILAGDEVAVAMLEAGVGRNVEVLQGLLVRVPIQARAAISRAVEAAIARSSAAVDRINASRPAGGRDNGRGGPPAGDPTPRATKTMTPRPTAKPTAVPTERVKATTQPTAQPTAEPTAAPTAEPTAEPTVVPERTPKPHPSKAPPGLQGNGHQVPKGD